MSVVSRVAWDLARAGRLYEGGATLREVGSVFSVSSSVVRRRLRAAGVVLRRGGTPMRGDVDTAEVIRRRAAGQTWREIAAAVGMTVSGARTRWRSGVAAASPDLDVLDSRDVRWQTRWAAVLHQHEETGRWPSVGDPDPKVSRLGRWLNAQRHKFRTGTLQAARQATMLAAGYRFTTGKRSLPSAAQLAKQYADGATLGELGRTYGMSAKTVRRMVVEDGTTIRSQGRVPTDWILDIQDWGASASQIAAMVGLTEAAVRGRLRRAHQDTMKQQAVTMTGRMPDEGVDIL